MSRLSVVIPCFNEEKTLVTCVDRVLEIAGETLSIQIIIVDDYSTDSSLKVAHELMEIHPDISVLHHDFNQGKGAALRTGFQHATGDYVAVQDADLEYDPNDFKKLLKPLEDGNADVVLGSRFLSGDAHRVLYFWHSLGNRFLTLLSNIFTDLNLTDMETCYKVFRRDVIQGIEIKENRFGFEPEIVAKIAHLRLRIYEMGISYHGRSYEEGKKIGARDGLRAIYCILRYNAFQAPLPIQFFLYSLIGGVAAIVNYIIFMGLFTNGWAIHMAAPLAFVLAAAVNYFLVITFLFRHKARWKSALEVFFFLLVVLVGGGLDLFITRSLFHLDISPGSSKLIATALVFIFNFLGRRFLVFPEPSSGPWK
ncbi:MAG: bifunctional glycosyltransferase family 2/GtrA family protein [Candidatus Marinimicrobia bacterium]|nr:bifunctional glycosyltransferase family 2/GtrA family protein [Candidatus Neomarinimicrobiota bacterium]